MEQRDDQDSASAGVFHGRPLDHPIPPIFRHLEWAGLVSASFEDACLAKAEKTADYLKTKGVDIVRRALGAPRRQQGRPRPLPTCTQPRPEVYRTCSAVGRRPARPRGRSPQSSPEVARQGEFNVKAALTAD